MPHSACSDVTRLLNDWSQGDRAALDQLLPLVYDDLRTQARGYMRRERANHTLQPTALVHEAYGRLVDQKRAHWQNRAQFFGVAAQAMRRILVDHARRRCVGKRGGGAPHVAIDDVAVAAFTASDDVLALDEAMSRLAEFDERKARVVELRVFGGLTIAETAAVLEVANTTVITDYQAARAWLYLETYGSSGDN